MLEAYDTQLEMLVTGDEAKNNGNSDYYRYECACCGESVFIAAAESRAMVTHFRHLSGNNDTACDLYLGGQGQRFYEKGTSGGNVEMYFDEFKKVFQLSIAFSETAIREHEKAESTFYISGTRNYTDGTSSIEQPFFAEKITKYSFAPNEQKRIIVSHFSRLYVLNSSIVQSKKYIEWFRDRGSLAVFKVLSSADGNISARLIKSKMLYTGVRYLVISQSQHSEARQFSVPQSIESERDIRFSTMDRNFFGRLITIKDTGFEANRWCADAGYDLAESEQFGILWPPMAVIDGVQTCDSTEAIVFSSFQLRPKGNIKINTNDICGIGNCCYKLKLTSKIRILYKNAEATISHEETNNPIDELQFSDIFSNIVKTTLSSKYFGFTNDGVLELPSDIQFPLFGSRKVRKYRSNYPLEEYKPLKTSAVNSNELIADIIKVYRVLEKFVQTDFSMELTPIAERIVEESRGTGLINSAIKRLIIGGIL